MALRLTRLRGIALATFLLLLLYTLALTALVQKSPTYDEQGFIVRGLAYLRQQNRHMRVGHPLGLNAFNAALLVGDETVHLPLDHPSWQETGFHRPAELFLWEIGNNVERIIFIARLPTLWLGLLLAAVCGRWAWQLTRHRGAGLLALALIALDPNMIAHSGLATTDLGLAATAGLAGFTLWRLLQRPSWSAAVLAGAAFGLLQNSKFTALLFIPLFGMVLALTGIRGWRRSRSQPAVGESTVTSDHVPLRLLPLVAVYAVAAILTLWATYGFEIGTLPATVPTAAFLGGRTVPLAHHLEQLLDIGGRMQKSTPAFLLGRYSDRGWWYYFPVAFLLKTPLPTLILLAWALLKGRAAEAATRFLVVALLLPPLGYMAIALTSDINLGYRHLLPMLPFLAVFTASRLIQPQRPASTGAATFFRRHTVIVLLIAWLFFSSLNSYPHFLAYFNPLAGGPDRGWGALVDSNIDWGQDLAGLKRWLDANKVDHVWLSYFGTARPEYYNIPFTGLDSFPPRLMDPQARPFYPYDPAPGIYAISVTNLQGVLFQNHDQFAWFREREPLAKVGYSIFIYEVPTHGAPVALALGSMQADEILPADYAQLGTNAVTMRWFDAGDSLLLPGSLPNWLVVASAATLPDSHLACLNAHYQPVTTAGDYRLFRARPTGFDASGGARWHDAGSALMSRTDGQELHFMGFAWETDGADFSLQLQTVWRQAAAPQPVKIFVHLLDENGNVVSQWDGLAAAWQGWRNGDTLWQRHDLALPPELPDGVYQLWAGMYHPDSGERGRVTAVHEPEPSKTWRAETGDDRIFLDAITLPRPRTGRAVVHSRECLP